MKRPMYGPSIYYATDKNVFDALNQHKVTKAAVQLMLLRRNIIASRLTPKVELAAYFSVLNHDYSDHQEIAKRLGIVSRRERTTSMSIAGVASRDNLWDAASSVKSELESQGDVVRIAKGDDRITVYIQYSTVDYRRSEFTQTQHHKGKIELIGSTAGYVVRCSHADHVIDARDAILQRLVPAQDMTIEKSMISLANFSKPEDRSSFFNDLINGLDGFILYDVKEVFAYKARPDFGSETNTSARSVADESEHEEVEFSESDDEYGDELAGSHVERVNLRGDGVTRSNFLIDALEDDYYIVRVRWEAKRHTGLGQIYIIDAMFADPATCSDFSFMLKGIYPIENGRLLTRQSAPDANDVEVVSHAIEAKAATLIRAMRKPEGGGARHDDTL